MFRWLVNVGLLGLPIGITLGILLGLQSHYDATGQGPLFSPPDDEPGNTNKKNNGLEWNLYCQKAFGVEPDTKGQEYTLNPNQWGWTEGDDGKLCMNVTTFNNDTYPDDTAPAFSVAWQYPQGPESQPVHAFPNILVDGNSLPVKLNNLSALNFDIEWSYQVGNVSIDTATGKTNETALDAVSTNANVAIDMFMDADKTNATNSTAAKYEVMVWFADFGSAAQPIGYDSDDPVNTTTVDGVKFDLFWGQNSLEQYVLTWVAQETTTKFNNDLSPLIKAVTEIDHADFPSTSDYLGYIALGTECYYADKTVTFAVPKLSITVD